jgi:hypothetical protein
MLCVARDKTKVDVENQIHVIMESITGSSVESVPLLNDYRAPESQSRQRVYHAISIRRRNIGLWEIWKRIVRWRAYQY